MKFEFRYIFGYVHVFMYLGNRAHASPRPSAIQPKPQYLILNLNPLHPTVNEWPQYAKYLYIHTGKSSYTLYYIYTYIYMYMYIYIYMYLYSYVGISPECPFKRLLARWSCWWWLPTHAALRPLRQLWGSGWYLGLRGLKGFPKIRGTFLGFPILRSMVFRGLYRDPPT